MNSGTLIALGVVAVLSLSSCQSLGLPASAGLPTPAPGQGAAPAAVPTLAPPGPVVPTVELPVPAVPTVPPQPISTVIPTAAPSVVIPSGPDPIPSGGGQGTGTDSGGFIEGGIDELPPDTIEPFPEGSRPSSSGSASSGSASSVACGRRVTYVVRPGDNLFRIALRYRTTTQAIARLNHIPDVREISVGQRLIIVTCRQGSSSGYGTYVVQAGDNLFRIALNHGTTVAAIRAANGLRSNLIVPGQVLYIP